jgi:uncharacterized membrane protein YcaP (DUF421 family)
LAVLFQDWTRLLVLLATAVIAYPVLIVVLRAAGKRTLSKLNVFDFIVTVALGSTLATVILSREIPLVEGVIALVLLVGLQYLVAKLSRRWPRLRRMVKSVPTVLLYEGVVREDALTRERLTRKELAQVVRQHGHASFSDVACVVLETDGTFSVLTQLGDKSALIDVRGARVEREPDDIVGRSDGRDGPAQEDSKRTR